MDAARVLLQHGRCESACKLLDDSMSQNKSCYGADSQEYFVHTVENIEMLLQNSLEFIDSGKPESAIPLLSKVLDYTSNKSDESPMTDDVRMRYRASASFLNGCVEKNRKCWDSSLNFFLEAANHFESCQMVTELALSYVGACHALLELDRFDEAASYSNCAEELLSSPDCDSAVANPVYETRTFVYMKRGQFDLAQESLVKAMRSRKMTENLSRKKNPEQSRCSSVSSVRSTDSTRAPTPPQASNRGSIRGRMMQRKGNSQNEQIPKKELGQLMLSISKLMTHC